MKEMKNNSSADRENLRGGKYHLIEIDECPNRGRLPSR